MLLRTRILQLGAWTVLVAPAGGCTNSPDGDNDGGTTDSLTTTEPTPTTSIPTSTDATAATTADAMSTGEPESTTDADTPICGGAAGPWDHGFSLGPPELPAGDIEYGAWAVVHQDYVSCGLPYDLFQLSKGLLGTLADGEPLPGRIGKAANLPYNWNLIVSEGGTELAVMNCLTCHAGHINGELVIGLGRHDADYTTSFSEMLGGVPPLPEWTDAGKEINKFRKRYDVLGPFVKMHTIGSNPADIVAVMLASHRDPQTLAWSDEQLIPIFPPPIPVDTPPWWRVAKKAGHFYNGMSRGDHRGTMMFASSLCVDNTSQAAAMLDYFRDIRAYLASIEAPAYPWPVDAELAATGREIFECTCAGCHGTYSADPSEETYPNLLFPVAVVGTDATVAEQADAEFGLLVDWFNASWYGNISQLEVGEPFSGYVAPPLDGIWATAPFFHNGSVPTLELVLDSSQRPSYWRRIDYDSSNYDTATLGWPWQATQSAADTPESQRKHVYDTTILGHSNSGHVFGDHLSTDERKAVLEYLKTL